MFPLYVIPHLMRNPVCLAFWIPAFAGMTHWTSMFLYADIVGMMIPSVYCIFCKCLRPGIEFPPTRVTSPGNNFSYFCITLWLTRWAHANNYIEASRTNPGRVEPMVISQLCISPPNSQQTFLLRQVGHIHLQFLYKTLFAFQY